MTARLHGFYDWALVGLIATIATERWLERRRAPLVVRGVVTVAGIIGSLTAAALIAALAPVGHRNDDGP